MLTGIKPLLPQRSLAVSAQTREGCLEGQVVRGL